MQINIKHLLAGGAGAVAIAAALITGPNGNDGLEGVRYSRIRTWSASGRCVMAIPAKISCSVKPTPKQSVRRCWIKT